ncbi:hypothetical protein DPMN_129341 [Dreissena polymorpha]|uniref:Exoribonuclease Xrn1 D2/D3 domain-containing protein n=1 Tax=Dreissena polymorpha TaxID=45954 RepID=A0A9D4JY61_DREPO|nr:hypothetical protein DPMN_129341 [Dreissena polymorpha]
MEKQFGNQPVAFALQATVKDLTVHYSSFCQFTSLTDYLPASCQVFMLGWPHYGCQGEVLDTDLQSGRVRINLSIIEEPKLSDVLNNQADHDEQYFQGYVLAQRLGISSHLFSRLTGCVFITAGIAEVVSQQQNPHRGSQSAAEPSQNPHSQSAAEPSQSAAEPSQSAAEPSQSVSSRTLIVSQLPNPHSQSAAEPSQSVSSRTLTVSQQQNPHSQSAAEPSQSAAEPSQSVSSRTLIVSQLQNPHSQSAAEPSQSAAEPSQSVSSRTLIVSQQQNPHRVNVGLNLKFTKRQEEVPGFTKLAEGNQWLYSNKLHEEYIKGLACTNVKSQKIGADLVPEGVILSLQRETDKIVEINRKRQKRIKMQVKPHLLYRPMITSGALIPDSSATYQLFDRYRSDSVVRLWALIQLRWK